MTLYLCNTAIIPQHYQGVVTVTTVSTDMAKSIWTNAVSWGTAVTAVGHESTAELLEILFEENKSLFNREQISTKNGDVILAFQLNERIDRGVELSRELLEKVGYEFRILIFGTEDKNVSVRQAQEILSVLVEAPYASLVAALDFARTAWNPLIED